MSLLIELDPKNPSGSFKPLEVVEYLFNNYKDVMDINIPTEPLQLTPLLLAAKSNRFEIFKLLCENGADFTQVDNQQRGVLFQSISFTNQNTKAFAYLLKHHRDQIDLEAVDCEGLTPFLYAVTLNKLSSVRTLIEEYGVNMDKCNIKGRNAVLIAMDGSQALFDYIVKAGVKHL